MADTGVTTPQGGESKKKKNRLLLYGGAGLIGVLFLASRHGSSAGTTTADQLATGELSAYQQGVSDAGSLLGYNPNGAAGYSGGGSSDTSTSAPAPGPAPTPPVATPPPAVTYVVNPPLPAQAAPAAVGSAPTATPAPPASTPVVNGGFPPVGSPAGPHGAYYLQSGPNKPSAPPGFRVQGVGNGGWIAIPTLASAGSALANAGALSQPVHPSQPHLVSPAPANKSGQHPNTHHKSHRGHAKKSPVTVESMDGAGHGVTVFGRDFPGAISHRIGPPRIQPGVGVTRDVTIIYGGHTETHQWNSGRWIENVPGKNPLKNRTRPNLVLHDGKVSV